MRNDSLVSLSRNQVSSPLGDEVAILQVKSGVYYGLNTVGARIWQLLQQPLTVGKITAAILEEFDVEPERCARDVVVLLEKLEKAGLIEVQDEKDS